MPESRGLFPTNLAPSLALECLTWNRPDETVESRPPYPRHKVIRPRAPFSSRIIAYPFSYLLLASLSDPDPSVSVVHSRVTGWIDNACPGCASSRTRDPEDYLLRGARFRAPPSEILSYRIMPVQAAFIRTTRRCPLGGFHTRKRTHQSTINEPFKIYIVRLCA